MFPHCRSVVALVIGASLHSAFAVEPATAVAKSSAKPSSPLPAYVGPPGTYFSIPSTNTPASALPSVYRSAPGSVIHPFDLWGGGAWSDDLRALVLRSSGHTDVNFQSSLRAQFLPDYASVTWIYANNPPKLWRESDLVHATGAMPDESIGTPHSYQGLSIRPIADGGGPDLLTFAWAGLSVPSFVAALDLTKTEGGYGYFAGADPRHPIYARSVYPIAAYWKGHGVFLGSEGPAQYPDVLLKLDGKRENRHALTTNYANGAQLVDHVHQQRIGINGGDLGYGQKFFLNIEELEGVDAMKVHRVSIANPELVGVAGGQNGGLMVRSQRMGWSYWERYDRIVGYFEDAVGGPVLVVLTPPASGKRLVDDWICSVERPVRKEGDRTAPGTLPRAVNSIWGKAAVVAGIDSYVIAPSATAGLVGIRPSFARGMDAASPRQR